MKWIQLQIWRRRKRTGCVRRKRPFFLLQVTKTIWKKMDRTECRFWHIVNGTQLALSWRMMCRQSWVYGDAECISGLELGTYAAFCRKALNPLDRLLAFLNFIWLGNGSRQSYQVVLLLCHTRTRLSIIFKRFQQGILQGFRELLISILFLPEGPVSILIGLNRGSKTNVSIRSALL